jgi:hypothetical protein
MKALGEGVNFSFGASSKNIFNRKDGIKEYTRKEYFEPLLTAVGWTSFPGVNPEKSSYGYSATNWEYCYKLINLVDSTRIPARSADGKFFFLADPDIYVVLEYDQNFSINFESTFGVNYKDWSKQYGDLFFINLTG